MISSRGTTDVVIVSSDSTGRTVDSGISSGVVTPAVDVVKLGSNVVSVTLDGLLIIGTGLRDLATLELGGLVPPGLIHGSVPTDTVGLEVGTRRSLEHPDKKTNNDNLIS